MDTSTTCSTDRWTGIDYVVSGAGGKLDERPPNDLDRAGTRSWAAEAHCLLVDVTADQITVTPYAGMAANEDQPRTVERRTPDGGKDTGSIIVTH